MTRETNQQTVGFGRFERRRVRWRFSFEPTGRNLFKQ